MRACSDFSRASRMVVSRFTSMPSNKGHPNFARMIQRIMKATSMGMNSFILGRIASMPPSEANAYAGQVRAKTAANNAAQLSFAALFLHFNFACLLFLISESLTYKMINR